MQDRVRCCQTQIDNCRSGTADIGTFFPVYNADVPIHFCCTVSCSNHFSRLIEFGIHVNNPFFRIKSKMGYIFMLFCPDRPTAADGNCRTCAGMYACSVSGNIGISTDGDTAARLILVII